MPRYKYSDDSAMFPVNVKSGSGLAGSAAGAAVCASRTAGAANNVATQNDVRILFMGTTLSIRETAGWEITHVTGQQHVCHGQMPHRSARYAPKHRYLVIELVRKHRSGSLGTC